MTISTTIKGIQDIMRRDADDTRLRCAAPWHAQVVPPQLLDVDLEGRASAVAPSELWRDKPSRPRLRTVRK